MSKTKKFDLVVIGGGPGGYVCAIRAAQLGFKVACVDENSIFGGTCLRVGCIPSKAMLESSELYHKARTGLKEHGIATGGVELDLKAMLKRKDRVVSILGRGIGGVLKKNGIASIQGRGRLDGPGRVRVSGSKGEETLEASHIVLATGSKSATLPGIEPDGDRICTSTEALEFSEVPRRLVVIGAGAIGLELGSVWNRLGSEVTVVEYLDRILPGMDLEIAQATQKILNRQGLRFELSARVEGVERHKEACLVRIAGRDEPLECDRVLMAVGRRAHTENLGLETVGLEPDERGFLKVDDQFSTGVPGLYAIGDVVGGAMLAHKAEDEGVALAELLKTGVGHVDYDTIPAVVYTHPEVAAVGRTEEQLKAEGTPYRAGRFPFVANGRARAIGQTDGMVKVLAHERTDRILGVHIVGPHAGDLLSESVVGMSFGASSEDLARISHAHPTLTEVTKEAALAVDGRALHS